MKKLKFTICILFFTLVTFSQDQSKNFEGNWFTSEMENTTISIFLSTDNYWYGKIIKSDVKENIGKILLDKLTYDKKNKSMIGKLIRPTNGMTVNATLTIVEGKKLIVEGKKMLFTKTVNWTRTD